MPPRPRTCVILTDPGGFCGGGVIDAVQPALYPSSQAIREFTPYEPCPHKAHLAMVEEIQLKPRSNFRKFFLRGLAILLPSVLTIWILIAAYGFVQSNIAQPVNSGLRQLILYVTPWPRPPERLTGGHGPLTEAEARGLIASLNMDPVEAKAWKDSGYSTHWVRGLLLARWWQYNSWLLDLIGLVIAVVLIYTVGVVVGSFIGRRLYLRGEVLMGRIPVIRYVYPSVKQITDFLVGGGEQKMAFTRVVAVEYPRKGMWSIGLVTGDALRTVSDRAGGACVTVFMPSSPTPFTGYVVIAAESDTMDLPMTIEEAIRFVVSGGVIAPPSQKVNGPASVSNALPTPRPYDTVPAVSRSRASGFVQ